jgi:hypothetical protein
MPGEAKVPAWVDGLMALRFVAARPADPTDDGRVAVRVPRFDGPWLRRWLVPLLKRPDFHIRLDALGSAAWELCDGTRTGEEVAAELVARFPDQADVRLRLAVFLRTLSAQGHLRMR